MTTIFDALMGKAAEFRAKHRSILAQPAYHSVSDLAKGRAKGYLICADELEALAKQVCAEARRRCADTYDTDDRTFSEQFEQDIIGGAGE